jgi:hypothetical protein
LLRLDFAGQDVAIRSTERWIKEVGVLGGVDKWKWGWTVVGKNKDSDSKKRVAEEDTPTVQGVKANGESGAAPKVLNMQLLRKKPKLDPRKEPGDGDPDQADRSRVEERNKPPADVVNVLGEGLVRKKDKR